VTTWPTDKTEQKYRKQAEQRKSRLPEESYSIREQSFVVSATLGENIFFVITWPTERETQQHKKQAKKRKSQPPEATWGAERCLLTVDTRQSGVWKFKTNTASK
jgi:hypothetical protein